MNILVAGGAGYIGGVTTHLMQEYGYNITVLDNLSTGHQKNIPAGVELVRENLSNYQALEELFDKNKFDLVINFAAKIQVNESMEKPKEYFDNNVFGAMNLIDLSARHKVRGFIFSSTAAVYGNPKQIPIQESDTKNPINPYGVSKYIVEQILDSYQNTHDLNWCALRYFNAAGAHNGVGPDYPFKTHLIPIAVDKLIKNEEMKVFGNDYDTPDGTCIRDYVHVYDIAKAHCQAAATMLYNISINQAINLGSGKGYSVLEVLSALEAVTGKTVTYEFAPRRQGDPAKLVASNKLAGHLLGWKPEKGLKDTIEDTWTWQKTKRQNSQIKIHPPFTKGRKNS